MVGVNALYLLVFIIGFLSVHLALFIYIVKTLKYSIAMLKIQGDRKNGKTVQ